MDILRIKRSESFVKTLVRVAALGISAYALRNIALAVTPNAYLSSLISINQGRGQSLENAAAHHPEDWMKLAQALAPLNPRQSLAVANKVGRTKMNETNGKLHQAVLKESIRVAEDIYGKVKKKK